MKTPPLYSRDPVWLIARTSALALALLAAPNLHAVTYYWDTNDSTAGFGTAGGTWAAPTTNNSTQGWSTSSAGTDPLSGTTTPTAFDALNFGTTANGLGAGTITVSGSTASGGLTFGSTNGEVILNGGTISVRGNIGSSADNTSNMQTINSNVIFNGSTSRRIGGGSSIADRLTINGNITTDVPGVNVLFGTKDNLGMVTLNGTNTFTGNFVIQTGQLNVSSVNNIGVAGTLGNGTTLIFANGGSQTPNLWYTGTSAGSTNRTIQLNSGTTRIISQDAKLTLAGNISPIGATPILQLSGDGGGTFNEVSGVISGNTSVQVVSHQPVGGTAEAGAWILSNTNTYNGTTTINNGTLQIDGNIANSGLVINASGIISPGTTAAADTFGTSSITINGGGYRWTINSANGTAGIDYDQITSTGALNSTGLLTVYAYGTPGDWDDSASYTWDIFSANSVSGFSTGNFRLDLSNFNNGVAPTGGFTFSNPGGTGIIRLTYTAATGPVWSGGTGNWTTGFSANVTNGDAIAFSGASGGTATNNISSATLNTLDEIEFRSGAGAYTLAADAGSAGASGSSALTVTGSIINNSANTQTINMDVAPGSITNVGTLEIGASGRLNSGSYSNTISNSGTIIYSGTNSQTLSGSISGSGALTKNAASTLTLSGSNSYSGTTTINAGALRATHANALGTTAAGTTVASGAALELSGGISIGAEALTLSGTGISEGGALRNISGDNTCAGLITLGAATRINSDSGNLTISNAGTITGNGLGLTIGGSGNTSITSIIGTGAGTLTKDGTGRLTLSGANTYTGATTINDGILATSGANMLSDSTNITVNSGGTLSLGGADTVGTLSGAGAISIGANTLTTSSSSSATFSGNITGTTGGFTKAGSGTQTLSGSANSWNGTTSISAGVLTLSGNLSTTGAVKINGAAGPVLNITGNLTKSGGGGDVRSFQIAATPGTAATVNVSGSGILTLGAGMMLGDNGGGNGTMNVTGGTVTTNGQVWFSGANSTLNVSGGTFNAGTNNIRLGGGSGTTISTLSVSGSGTVIGGALRFGDGSAGASTIVNLGDGTAGGNLSIANMVYANGPSHTINFNGATLNVRSTSSMITTNTTTLVKAGGAVIDVNVGQTFTIGTNLTTDGTGGGLTKNGTGTLVLSGAGNNYTGTTTVNAGTLTLGANQNLGAIAGAGALNLASFTLTTNSSSDTTFSGIISGTGGSLTKNGTSTLTLTNASNSYTGATTINAGTFSISAVGALGSTSGVNLGNATELLYTGSAATLSRNITVTSGTTTVANSGSGELTLSGGLSNNGTTLALDGGAQGIDVTGAITGSLANSDLVVDGNVTLSTANSYNGQTTIHGNLTAAVADALGSTSSVVINTGGSLLVGANETINDSADMTLAGGTLKFSGNFTETLGSLTLSANSVIDMGGGNIALEFADMVAGLTDTTRLNIYNYQMDSDHIYFGSNANLSSSLQFISFYSDFGSSFIGNGFIEGFSPPYELQAQAVQVVPEPETWATGLLLLLGGGAWMWRKRRNLPTTGKAGALEEDLPKVGR